MLKQRIITALVLLAILLPALFASTPEPFAAVALVLIAAGAWEWGRLNTCGQPLSLLFALICVGLCAGSWRLGWLGQSMPMLWAGAGVAWVLGGAWLLRRGVAGWSSIPHGVRLPVGLLALWLAWLAVAQARFVGINFLLSILVLVWVADIFAYFAGRAFGGVWGGMAGVVTLAFLWAWADRALGAGVASFYTRLSIHGGWLLLIAVLFMAAMSVVGDLVESLIKRSAGVKDSSGLLPGHGGVLDRVDALLPTLPLAMMLVTLGRP